MGGPVFSAKLMINNEAMNASEGATFERIDPLTGDVATIASAGSVADMTRAANAAAAAFPDWSQTGPGERRRLLNAAADILEARTSELIAAMTGETGATAQWAAINCGLGADILREAAAMTTQISGEIIPSGIPGSLAMAVRQPAGVCVGIAPGMRLLSSAPAPLPCRLPAATPSS